MNEAVTLSLQAFSVLSTFLTALYTGHPDVDAVLRPWMTPLNINVVRAYMNMVDKMAGLKPKVYVQYLRVLQALGDGSQKEQYANMATMATELVSMPELLQDGHDVFVGLVLMPKLAYTRDQLWQHQGRWLNELSTSHFLPLYASLLQLESRAPRHRPLLSDSQIADVLMWKAYDIKSQDHNPVVSPAERRMFAAFVKDKDDPRLKRNEEKLVPLSPNASLSTEQEQRLNQELARFLYLHAPFPDQLPRRQLLLSSVQALVKQVDPGCVVEAFGSSAAGFASVGSDVDLAIVKASPGVIYYPSHFLERVWRLLSQNKKDFRPIEAILHARVPVLKFYHRASFQNADLVFAQPYTQSQTRLLARYAAYDKRVTLLVAAVKHWAKQRDLRNAWAGTLNSFGWTLMALQSLQLCSPPVLPSLQTVRGPVTDPLTTVDSDAAVFLRLGQAERTHILSPPRLNNDNHNHNGTESKSQSQSQSQSQSPQSLAALLLWFFELFGTRFEARDMCVSVRKGQFTKAQQYRVRATGFHYKHQTVLCIEDPFDPTDNVARSVKAHRWLSLRQELRRAHEMMLRGASFLRHVCEPVSQES